MSQNAIVPFAGNDIVRSLGDLMSLGEALIKSGMLPKSVNTKETAVAIILKGREIGIGAMEALSSINVIQGKPTTSPQLMMALARRTKELEDFQIQDDGHKCTVTIKRKGQSPVSASFSMDDAKAMNLSNKDNWIKQARTMRQWRAVAANLRITFPDAISGLYTYEEMGAEVDVNDEGQMTVTKMPVIEGEVVKGTVVEPKKTYERPRSPEKVKSLILADAEKNATTPLRQGQTLDGWRGAVKAVLESFGISEKQRLFLEYVFGVTSTGDLPLQNCIALTNWFARKNVNGKWEDSDDTNLAKAEFNLIAEKAMIDKGQIPIPQF